MIGTALSVLVAVLHFVFFAVESLLWTSPGVRKRFQMSVEQAEATKVLAQNQGIYNFALASSILWAVFSGNRSAAQVLLAFVVFVGIYGGVTAKRSIIVIQSIPAAAAIVATYLNV
jgi:putative membrane protein